jgi:Site-specific recombinase XerD
MQTIVVLGKRAGITNIRCSPHTFRHTFATMCLRNGAGEFEVQSLMGHSTLTQTRKYAASLNSEVAVQGHKKFSPVDNLKL